MQHDLPVSPSEPPMPTEGPVINLAVHRGADIVAIEGAHLGDPLGFAGELAPDDVYELAPGARPERLSLAVGPGESFAIAPGSPLGAPGAAVFLDSCLTFMAAGGRMLELLVLVEVDRAGAASAVYAHPLDALEEGAACTLVSVDPAGARRRFAELGCVSFSRGTRITLASGEQRPIETLAPGDRVLTRDDGAQEIRWIGQTIVRAAGAFAPIAIAAGALNNAAELVVSPDHRLFVYQREDALGAGRPEVVVRARHLVNGTTVRRRPGGFVEYFQLLLDSHQIIYAEGIAAESMLLDARTRPVLPAPLDRALAGRLPREGGGAHRAFEVREALLARPDAAELLRRASTR